MEAENKGREETPDEKRIARMDGVAEVLLALVEKDSTSEAQKGRLFQQVLSWYKVRATLAPSGEGDKLKEMQNAIKSKDGKRSGSSGHSGSGEKRNAKDGRAIEDIIRSLPKPAHSRAAGGDQARTERPSGSADSNGGGIPLNGGGNVAGNSDVAGGVGAV